MSLEETLQELIPLYSDKWNLFFEGKLLIYNNPMKVIVLFYDNDICVSKEYGEEEKGDNLKVLSLLMNPNTHYIYIYREDSLDHMVDDLIQQGLGVGCRYSDFIFVSKHQYLYIFDNKIELCSNILEILCDMTEDDDYELFNVTQRYGENFNQLSQK